MLRVFFVTAFAMSFASVPGVVFAQVAEHFDTSHRITIKGTVVEFAVGPGPRSYLLIEAKDAAGNPELWAAEGHGVAQLMKSGWRVKEQVRLGAQLTATVYLLKATAPLVDPPPGASERVATAAKTRRLVHGLDVTFSDGKTLPFGAAK